MVYIISWQQSSRVQSLAQEYQGWALANSCVIYRFVKSNISFYL
jgi:hypothetical protein